MALRTSGTGVGAGFGVFAVVAFGVAISASAWAGDSCENQFSRSFRAELTPETTLKKSLEPLSNSDYLKRLGLQNTDRKLWEQLVEAERRLKNRRWWGSAPLSVRELRMSQKLRLLDQALQAGEIPQAVALVRELFLKTETAFNEILVSEVTMTEALRRMRAMEDASPATREAALRARIMELDLAYRVLEGQAGTQSRRQEIWQQVEEALTALQILKDDVRNAFDGRIEVLSPELRKLFEDIDSQTSKKVTRTYEDLKAEYSKAQSRREKAVIIFGREWREYLMLRNLLEVAMNPEDVKKELNTQEAERLAVTKAKIAVTEALASESGSTESRFFVGSGPGDVEAARASYSHVMTNIVRRAAQFVNGSNYAENAKAVLSRVGMTRNFRRAFGDLAPETGRPSIREMATVYSRTPEAWIAETRADTWAQWRHNMLMPVPEKLMSGLIWGIDRIQFAPAKSFFRKIFGFAYRYRARSQHFPLVEMLMRDVRQIPDRYRDFEEFVIRDKAFLYSMARYAEADALTALLKAEAVRRGDTVMVVRFEKAEAARRKFGPIAWKNVDQPAMLVGSAVATTAALASMVGWDRLAEWTQNPTVQAVAGVFGAGGFVANEVTYRLRERREQKALEARILADKPSVEEVAAMAEPSQDSPVALKTGGSKPLIQELVDQVRAMGESGEGKPAEKDPAVDPDYDADLDGPVPPGQP